jgi:hypothetical protein
MSHAPDAAANTPQTVAVPAETDEAEATLLRWRVHRLRESPRGALLVLAGTAGVLLAGNLLSLHPITLLVGMAALMVSLSDYLLPVTYRLTEKGAHADVGLNRLFIAWKDVKRATHGNEGIFLSPFPQPSRRDGFRGVRLRYGMDNRDAVLENVRNLWHATRDEPTEGNVA